MIDIEELKENFGFNDQNIKEFLLILKNGISENLILIKNNLENRNFKGIKQSAHKQIASFKCINEDQLSGIYNEIEVLATEESNFEQIDMLYKSSLIEIDMLIKEIENYADAAFLRL